MEALSGLLIGILGNLHCLGMCGPLALVIPHTGKSGISALVDGILLHSGRIFLYGVLGSLAGYLGNTILLAGFQESISIIVGSALLLLLLLPKGIWINLNKIHFVSKFSEMFKKLFSRVLNIRTRQGLFLIGIFNGLLPCGLVYIALATSVVFQDSVQSSLFMIMFGIGTSPLLIVMYTLKKNISLKFRTKLVKLIPFGVALVACLLILRGLALGIPYISPVLPDKIKSSGECCH